MGLGSSAVLDPGTMTALGRPSAFLHAGGFFVSAEAAVVTTILGSCVAVCLFDEKRGIGGMNHYLLDYPVGAQQQPGRFGEQAIPDLILRVVAAGAQRRALVAKIFGGAAIMRATTGGGLDLGARNTALALRLLETAQIPVAESDTGGARGRKLIFQTGDGVAWVKEL